MHLDSVADAVAHVKRNGTDIFHTQVTRAANKGATSKGWQFSFEDEIPHPPLVATPPPPLSGSVLLPPPYLFSGDKLLGDILTCTNCNHNVHALCTQRGHCFKCICRVCNQPPSTFRGEVVCKACTPRPREHPPPAKKESVRSNPHGKPAAHGCNMPMG